MPWTARQPRRSTSAHRLGVVAVTSVLVALAACAGPPTPLPEGQVVGSAPGKPTKPAPTSTTSPAPTVAPGSSTTTTPSAPGGRSGVAVDESLVPADRSGVDGPRIGTASYSKHAGDGSAAFRINCSLSHMRFDDPIVFPGRAGASHLHAFFGNTDADAASTPGSIISSGNSTCTGGTANRSSYWAPAMIDTTTGAPVISEADQTDRDNFLQVYYKTGYQGVLPATVQNFPEGLRMIAGSGMSTGPQDAKIVRYSCEVGGATRPNLGSCAPGQLLVMSIAFPQCWDGVNLDSPDHKSHMAYGAGWPDRGCPSTHPVPLAEITQNYRYRVPAGGMTNWRLASDMYEGPAGYSAHADWMNGWDPAVFQRVVDNCYRGGFDCSMNLLGDGQMLL